MDIESHIRSVMEEITQTGNEMDHLTESNMIEKLRKRGIVDEIMNHLHFSNTEASRPAAHLINKDDQLTRGFIKTG